MSIAKYTRGRPVQLTANFKSTEFDCKGRTCKCTVTRIDRRLVRKLQVLRRRLGKAITITSGNRCTYHNRACGGTSSSYHLNSKGQAADISVSGIAPAEVARLAQEIGFTGIGCYNGSAGRFVHVDTRPDRYFWLNTSGRNITASTHGGTAQRCPHTLGSTTLRRGSSGTSVRALQWMLNRCGFSCDVDGDFGPKTESALKAFQRDMCLESDGIAGRHTLTALKEATE